MFNKTALLLAILTFSNSIGFAIDYKLYPVQNGRIITNQHCNVGTQMSWDATGGLKKGEELLALSKAGLTSVSAGELSCFIGECRANYVSVRLIGGDDQVLGVIRKTEGTGLRAVPIQVAATNSNECDDLYSEISLESLPEVLKERRCQRVTFANSPSLTVATKGFRQENDWVFYIVQAQVEGTRERVEIDRDTNPLEPVLGLIDTSNDYSILWRKESGICCPSALTLVLSDVNEGGVIRFEKAYKAGGQPCD